MSQPDSIPQIFCMFAKEIRTEQRNAIKNNAESRWYLFFDT